MTRLEKYHTYRMEISQIEKLYKFVEDQADVAIKYKNKIDSINPNILASLEIKNIDLKPLISVNEVDKNKFHNVKSFISNLTNENKEKMHQQLKDFLYSYENDSIIDPKTNQLSSKWFKNDEKYNELKYIQGLIEQADHELIKFNKSSGEKIDNLNRNIEISKQDTNENLSKYEIKINEDQYNEKSFKKLYIGIVSSVGTVLLITIILVIVGVIFIKN